MEVVEGQVLLHDKQLMDYNHGFLPMKRDNSDGNQFDDDNDNDDNVDNVSLLALVAVDNTTRVYAIYEQT